MGNVLVKLERSDEAVLSFQHALKFNPRHLEAASACADLLFNLKRYDEALAYFNQSDEIEPGRVAPYPDTRIVPRARDAVRRGPD